MGVGDGFQGWVMVFEKKKLTISNSINIHSPTLQNLFLMSYISVFSLSTEYESCSGWEFYYVPGMDYTIELVVEALPVIAKVVAYEVGRTAWVTPEVGWPFGVIEELRDTATSSTAQSHRPWRVFVSQLRTSIWLALCTSSTSKRKRRIHRRRRSVKPASAFWAYSGQRWKTTSDFNVFSMKL